MFVEWQTSRNKVNCCYMRDSTVCYVLQKCDEMECHHATSVVASAPRRPDVGMALTTSWARYKRVPITSAVEQMDCHIVGTGLHVQESSSFSS